MTANRNVVIADVMRLTRETRLIRNPIIIGSLVGFVAFALLSFFGNGAEAPDDAITVIIVGTFFGMVGAIVGGLVGLPVYMVLKNNSKQNLTEQQAFKIDSEKPLKRVLGTVGIVLGIGLLAGSFIGFPDWMNFPRRGGYGLAVLFIAVGWRWLRNETYG